MIDDIQLIQAITPTDKLCEACIYTKQMRLPFLKVKSKGYIQRPLFTIHSNVCGKLRPTTVDDENWFVAFIGYFTHYTVIYLLTCKSDVLNTFKEFVTKSEAEFNLKIANLYCDNWGGGGGGGGGIY